MTGFRSRLSGFVARCLSLRDRSSKARLGTYWILATRETTWGETSPRVFWGTTDSFLERKKINPRVSQLLTRLIANVHIWNMETVVFCRLYRKGSYFAMGLLVSESSYDLFRVWWRVTIIYSLIFQTKDAETEPLRATGWKTKRLRLWGKKRTKIKKE